MFIELKQNFIRFIRMAGVLLVETSVTMKALNSLAYMIFNIVTMMRL